MPPSSLAAFALSASLLGAVAPSVAANDDSKPPEPVTFIFDKGFKPVLPPEFVTAEVKPALPPLMIDLSGNMFGRKSSTTLLCLSHLSVRLGELGKPLSPETSRSLRELVRTELEQTIEEGYLKFQFGESLNGLQKAEMLADFKIAVIDRLYQQYLQMGRDRNAICNTPMTDPSSPWYRAPR